MSQEQTNPWEKALLTAGATNASKLTMTAGLNVIKDRRCPRCGGQMGTVTLASGKRQAMYCNKDRVVIPLPVEGKA